MNDLSCGWEVVRAFESHSHYENLRQSLEQQVKTGHAKRRPVRRPYSGLETLNEQWYKCESSGELWRLIAPDPPFPGLFDRVH